MSIFDPQTSEDKMAWVPIIGCFLPIAVIVIAVIAAVFI